MRFVREFEDEILDALESNNPDIHYQAVCAAGEWAVDAAWRHVAALVDAGKTDKPLLLAAIGATAGISPQEAPALPGDLIDTDDEDIVEAALETLAMTEWPSDDDYLDEEDDDEHLH